MRNLMRGAVFAVAISVTFSAPHAVAQSLTDALIAAYTNSASLKSQQAQLRSIDEGVAQAFAAYRPSLNASGNAGFTHFTALTSAFGAPVTTTTHSASLTLSAELMLWDGGKTQLAAEVARLNVAVARESLMEAESAVLQNAVTAFMDMRRDSVFLQLAENNLRVLNRQVQAAKDRFEVGEARRTDVNLAEARQAAALATLALRQGTLEIARSSYYLATGTYPGDLKAPPSMPNIPDTLEAAKSIAMQRHPSIKRAKFLAEIAEFNVLRAEAAMKPTIKIAATTTFNGRSVSAGGDTATLNVTGSAPIYAGGALVSALRSSVALKQKARSDIQFAGMQVQQGVTMAFAQLQIARASITAQQKQVRASRVALRGIREEADLGARTTLDVLNAEQELVVAESNLADARRNEYVAVYSLLSSMGLLTVKHLGLGIKTYDTNANYNKVSTAPGPTDRGKLLNKIFTRAGKK